MTLIVELYGGPGTGKSTTAAQVFSALKLVGVNCELVTEYAKEWAWAGQEIGPYDQYYLAAKQMYRESRLLGKVDVIVTDSPVRLGHYYCKKYGSVIAQTAIGSYVRGYENQTLVDHDRFRVLLKRVKEFNPSGRYEDEEGAKVIDDELNTYLAHLGGPCLEVPADLEGAQTLSITIILEMLK